MGSFGLGRGIGLTDALHAAAEWWVILLFGLITQLADVWFLLLLSGGLYVAGTAAPWFEVDRRRGLFVLALVLTYVALIGALKALFQFPRPPGAGTPPELSQLPSMLAVLLEGTTTAESFGFPSGHALGSTMVWGGLALVFERGSLQKRLGVAAGVVLLVSVSRLVLGVHYLVDVVVGVGLGVIVLGVLYVLTENGTDPGPALLVAAVAGAVGLVAGVTAESVTAAGAAVGGWIAWRGVADRTPAHPTTGREVLAGVLVVGTGAVLLAGVVAADPPLAVAFLGTAVAAGIAVGAPSVGRRFA